jgi:hypothetical protein
MPKSRRVNRLVKLVRGSRDLGASAGAVALAVSAASVIDARVEAISRRISARNYHRKAGWS